MVSFCFFFFYFIAKNIKILFFKEKEIQLQQLQQQQEKNAGIHLSWAKKPVEPRKVKSLAEIQAEEQERLAKVNIFFSLLDDFCF